MPKVSVILSSYNHEKYISSAIESVLNQTFTDFELLIFDDGSDDNSREIIKSFKDERIKLFLYEENRGSYFALQEPLKFASGEYIAFHHSDDIWETEKLEKQVKFMDENPDYEVCFTLVKFIDENDEPYELPENHPYQNVFNQQNRPREKWLNHLFWRSNCFCNPSMLIRNVPENFILNPCLLQLPDYFMWVNLCLRKSPYVLQEELILFRLRRENQNSTSSWNLEKMIRVYNEHYAIAKSFIPLLNDEKFFLKVFPEAEEFFIDGEISAEFAFAKTCLKREMPAFQNLAVEILYDLLHNEFQRKKIKRLYNYDEKSFMIDTGKFDMFGARLHLKILNCKLFIDLGDGFKEENSISTPISVRPDGNFTAVFDFKAEKNIKCLRFDPDEKSPLSVKILKITVNGEVAENITSNAFKIVDGYFNFVDFDPFIVIVKEISAGNVHLEILGTLGNDALQNFESEYNKSVLEIQKKNSTIQELQKQIEDLQKQNEDLKATIQTIIQKSKTELAAKNDKIEQLQKVQQEILNSNSWKMTKPLRSIGKFFKNRK